MSSGSSSTQRPDPGRSFPATVRPEYHAQAMPMMSGYQPLPPPWFLPTATYPGQWVVPQCAVSFRPPPTRTFYHPTSSARDTSTPPPAYDETYYPPFPMTAPTPSNTQCQTQVIATPKTENINRPLGESHAKPELVPQGWLMGRSASDFVSPIASSSAGPSTATQFRPTPMQDTRPRLKRTWEARPRAVGSQHPLITSPHTGVFPNIGEGSGQSVWLDMHTDELSDEENDSDDVEEIPLVAYKQPTVHRRQVKAGHRKEKPQREDSDTDLERYPVSSLVKPGSPVASDSSMPVRDFIPYSYDDYTPRTRGQNKNRGDTQPSQIKRSETARDGSNQGIVRAPVKHESPNRNTSFRDCFGDTSDLTDLEDDGDNSRTGNTRAYVRRVPARPAKQSRPESTQETPQLRPTRNAARKASVLIQALNSPRRKDGEPDPSVEQHKRSRDIYVEVEDEDSEESQRSTGMRTIRNGKKAGKLSYDPVPDYGITKVRRGRVAASDPSLVKSSIVHVCPIPSCGACFKRREHVKRHVRGIHTMEKPFTCLHDGCEKSFARRDNLGLHYSKVHKMSNRKCLELLAAGDA